MSRGQRLLGNSEWDNSEWKLVEGAQRRGSKRTVAAIGAAVLVAGAGYGVFASGLSIADDSSFNAGTEVVEAGCQGTDPVRTKIKNLVGNKRRYEGVTVGKISANCPVATTVITVAAMDRNGNTTVVGTVTGLTAAGGVNAPYKAVVSYLPGSYKKKELKKFAVLIQ